MDDYVDARRRSQHKKVNWKTVEVVKQVTMDDYGAKKSDTNAILYGWRRRLRRSYIHIREQMRT